ncbi:MAG: DNA translocase FtsK [Treponema sp.]|nr:DNA translocase FtsK [Treponema sp.]
MEPLDDDIEAFEKQNADYFDDDFYDVDLNADDDDDLDAEIDDYEQRLEREELEAEAQNGEIATENQKSTSLDSIFAEMDDDAARDPQGIEPAVLKKTEQPAAITTIAAASPEEDFEEPVIDEKTVLDFEADGIFEDEDEKPSSDFEIEEPVFSDSDETYAEHTDEPVLPEDFDDIPVVDPLAPPVVDANGIPYETAITPSELSQQKLEAESAPATAVTAAMSAKAAPSAAAPMSAGSAAPVRQAMSVTVTAASPAPGQERPRHKSYGTYKIPTEGILDTYPNGEYWVIDDETRHAGEELKATLNEFKIEAEVTGIRKGPVVTMFEILPAPGVKLSKIVALQDNIALRLAASSVRIVAPIPGKHAVGIEVPNKERAIVSFKEIIEQDLPQFKKMAIPVVLGKDISGEAQLIDLAKTPHLLIAGSTGAGKSVCVNTMILSILYKRSPQDVKLIMIDPKIVELKLYNDIPHLLTPVITDSKRAFQSLQYCLCEMERRYALLDGLGVRDIVSYNNRIVERHIATEKLPYIVVIIDEFADLMATTGKELESTLARLAAMSRAVGIHLVLATQRPSIDVITGLIKANIPSRIAFMVASKMDSRIIIDQVGAEKLLGKGDMLYASATDPFPVRIQGTLVNDNEVERVVNCVIEYGEPDYIDDEIFVDDDDEDSSPGLFSEGDDPLYDEALEIVMQAGKASASYIQRRLKIGYNRAARLVEEMEDRGIVGPANGSKPREVIHMV